MFGLFVKNIKVLLFIRVFLINLVWVFFNCNFDFKFNFVVNLLGIIFIELIKLFNFFWWIIGVILFFGIFKVFWDKFWIKFLLLVKL